MEDLYKSVWGIHGVSMWEDMQPRSSPNLPVETSWQLYLETLFSLPKAAVIFRLSSVCREYLQK